MATDAVIIGGGFAGLAAAVRLGQAGHQVTVLEAAPRLGGRAYSFADRATGSIIDNGQHVLLGCYRQTIEFLNTIGSLDNIRFQPNLELEMLGLNGKHFHLRCPNLPAPWHLLAGLAFASGLSPAEKLRAAMFGRKLPTERNLGLRTVAEWLTELRQPLAVFERLWNPLALAALNTVPAEASAELFGNVLRQAFASPQGSAIGIPSVGLSELYAEPARRFIEARGGRIRLSSPVNAIRPEVDGAFRLILKDGEAVPAKIVIAAVPPDQLSRIVSPALLLGGCADKLTSFSFNPIISIHLWFDRTIIKPTRGSLGLIGTNVQWLFDRTSETEDGQRLALVISDARDLIDWSRQKLIETAVTELSQLLPATAKARLLHSLVIKERMATISHSVGSERHRIAAATSAPNLFLAGDWTDTELPATIESAVASGYRAAELAARYLAAATCQENVELAQISCY